jgi:predicted NAD/FAD-dependent oxidoreductase
MTDIGIVGAGAAAAAATHVLDETVPDASITVLEKSGGVCGRAATRRRGEVTYDYGANYLKADDDRVVDLPAICISHRKEGALRALYPRWSDGTHHSIEDCTRALCAGDDIENLRPS